MRGEDFLRTAELLLARPVDEPNLKSAAGRAYYAAFLEGRDWLRKAGIPIGKGMNAHQMVRDLLV